LLPFLLAALVLLLTPGPAVLYIIGRSLDQGRAAGLVSVAGIEIGNSCHVLAAGLGLSALLVASPAAFAVVQYLGAAYLVYLGIRRLLAAGSSLRTTGSGNRDMRRVFSNGLAVAVLNPKTALFFLAFLPQFVDPARGSISIQFLFLGALFVSMAVLTDSLYALLAGSLGGWIKSSPWFLRIDRYAVGFLYVILGITAALTGSHRSH
jgi:threonine/homoserine/homoserine lactone efflux protein